MSAAGRIVVVCTGNVCRSPYIERLLVAGLSDLDIEITSAGTHALVGHELEPGTMRLMEQAGLTTGDFVAQQVTAELVRAADLVLTATRDHRRQVAQLEPKTLRYVHAIDDFSDLVAGADLRQPAFLEDPHGSVVCRVAARAAARRDVVAARFADDAGIIDPFHQPEKVFSKMAEQVAKVIPPIVQAVHQVAAAG